jgi:ketosteroid isomerase-like protein
MMRGAAVTSVALAAGAAGPLLLPLTHAIAHPPAIVNEAGRKLIGDEVAAFRRDVAAAIKAKDRKRLDRMYSPQFVHTHFTGKVDDKQARITTLLKGEPVIETAPATDLVFRVPNDWVGIATGLSNLKASDGKTYAYRWTTTYVREGMSWHVAASQVTRLHEIKP